MLRGQLATQERHHFDVVVARILAMKRQHLPMENGLSLLAKRHRGTSKNPLSRASILQQSALLTTPG